MIVIRKRLIFWLIKAYIKKSKKILSISFLIGFMAFVAIILGQKYLNEIITLERKPVIGLVGAFKQDDLPDEIVSKLSRGLTRINMDQSYQLDLAEKINIEDSGRTYKFTINKDATFNDGSRLQSKDIAYNFTDVQINRPDEHTIIFKLKDPYSPFPAAVSKPIFKNGNIGTGEYNIREIKLNGSFVQELFLTNENNQFQTVRYVFYPTQEALKTAFALGEITQARGLSNVIFQDTSFEKFPNTKITPFINYKSLVTIFYNTSDPVFSDRKSRLALSYSVPDEFSNGLKTNLPYPKTSMYYNSNLPVRNQDLERAKILLPEEGIKLKLKVLKKYRKTADLITKEWEKIGVQSEIEEVERVPDRFQVYLGDFNVPADPDQYTLWHSDQVSNITRFKNLRIDKLLEDGRVKTNINERKKIYLDFQKFLLEEMPATFLYFPREYSLKKE